MQLATVVAGRFPQTRILARLLLAAVDRLYSLLDLTGASPLSPKELSGRLSDKPLEPVKLISAVDFGFIRPGSAIVRFSGTGAGAAGGRKAFLNIVFLACPSST